MRTLFAVVPLALFLACSGSTATLGGGDGGSSSEGGSGDATSGGSSSGGGSGSGGGDAAKGDGASDASSGPDGSSGGPDSSGGGPDSSGGDGTTSEGGACPDITGTYGQISTSGLGCGDLNTKAPECIVLAQEVCAFQLTSSSGVIPAVNGTVVLASDGSFSNASLQFGTIQRTGCTGQWDAGSKTLTLDCGGTGTTQSCVVTMVHSGAPCP
jgi:hypothetical protein